MSVAAEGSIWSDDVAEQIKILRKRGECLAESVEALRAEHGQRLDGLEAALVGDRAANEEALADMREQQAERDRQSRAIDARGLPLIGVSFLLAGLPDPIVAERWLGGLLIAFAVVVSVAVGVPWGRQRRRGGVSSPS
ncbi:hypothetical protein [Leekyejoonella antrihumi]|uniref:Uncharacterized protein n=1 Tax=Leekyejoonella antrihumi TaxID=1660198 RepID=A0A563E612_9MICO|nr:hypothetical protein [Leekyejoonella antrihumi]TWP37957.1 hypothetical protein FGL98_04405 [Leekyejoonella antrihumi]